MKKLRVDVWSDVVCPWCYIGKRRLEGALARFAHREEVEVVWRAFELDPGSPKVVEGDLVERIARKYGRTRAQTEEMMRHITGLAAAEGLAFDLERSRSGNTFDAHRVIHLGSERGLQDAVKERLFRGYMEERESIGDPEVLVRLGAEAGLDPDEVRAVLASDRYAREVRRRKRRRASSGSAGCRSSSSEGSTASPGRSRRTRSSARSRRGGRAPPGAARRRGRKGPPAGRTAAPDRPPATPPQG